MNNLELFDIYKNSNSSDDQLILDGLKDDNQKKIDSKFFYDEYGSHLFEEITKLDEYYPTRIELNILENYNKTINNFLPRNASIIEFGSGSNKKIKKLLGALDNPAEYIPIDISKSFLFDNAKSFAKNHPNIKVTAICAEFNQSIELNSIIKTNKDNVGFFPGSTIGNFSPINARNLLKKFAHILGEKNYLIIGVDLRKEKKLMEKAYNDSLGITAKFNKNILNTINDKLGSMFDQDKFEHTAFFNEVEKRIEMHLVSKIDHTVELLGQNIEFLKGESIHTENSYKYSLKEFELLANESGFSSYKIMKDDKDLFSIFILKVK